MKHCLLILLVFTSFSKLIWAQEAGDVEQKENYRKLFIEGCMTEGKKQKLGVNLKSFCNCSFEKLYSKIEESGADVNDSKAIDQLTQGKEYEKDVLNCLSSAKEGNPGASYENEFVKICAKSMNKDKFMKKNADANEICRCSYAKILDGPYSFSELSDLSSEVSEEYIVKISQDCIRYYFESKGIPFEQ